MLPLWKEVRKEHQRSLTYTHLMFLQLLFCSNPRHTSFFQWAKLNEYSVDHFGRLICLWLAAPKHLQSFPFGREPPAAWQLQTHSIILLTAVTNTSTFSLFILSFLFSSISASEFYAFIFFCVFWESSKSLAFGFKSRWVWVHWIQNDLSFAPRGCTGLSCIFKKWL